MLGSRMITLLLSSIEMMGKRDKREVILRAMLDLVVDRGFDDAPMSALVKKSHASPGVIYHYFPSKDDLIHAVYERVAATKHDVFFEGVSPQAAPREALLRMWLNAYRFYRTHRRETRFLDQYLNSSYCKGESDAHPESARIIKWLQ